jgi:hypothetical protein
MRKQSVFQRSGGRFAAWFSDLIGTEAKVRNFAVFLAQLKHWQASRFLSAWKGFIERSDFVRAQRETAGRGVVAGVFWHRGLWNRKQRGFAGQETQGDLTR